MAGLIPIFIAEEDEENSLGRERVFRDRRDPLDCFDDFELSSGTVSQDQRYCKLLICLKPFKLN